jgi:hypothetical protein
MSVSVCTDQMSGIALRMAFELDLHRLGQDQTLKRPLSVSAGFSGPKRELERAWLVLYVTDRRQVSTTLRQWLFSMRSDAHTPA